MRWSGGIGRTLADDLRDNPPPRSRADHAHFHEHGGRLHAHRHRHTDGDLHAHSALTSGPAHPSREAVA